MSFCLTDHARKRFVQRSNHKYDHMQSCKNNSCEICDKFRKQITYTFLEEKEAIDDEMQRRLSLADENKAYLNNSNFMNWYYEKYGYDKRFRFLIHEDLLFVVISDDGDEVVTTCVKAKTHISGICYHATPKFRKKERVS